MADDAAVMTVPRPAAAAPELGESAHPTGKPCKVCGGLVEAGDKFCHACGTVQEVEPAAPAVEQKHFRCQNCSAEINVDPGQRSITCPFCDSTYVLELPATESNRQRPEFVVGFAVSPTDAVEKFQSWLRQNGWFRPGDLKTAQIQEKLRGVYLPFWSFSMLAESRWSSQIGEYWYRTETYTVIENGKTVTRTREVRETEWWNLSGQHHNYYSGYLVSGSKGLPQTYAERIKPFRLESLKRYQPYFLAGWLSEEYSIAEDAALELCKQEFSRWEQQNVASFLPGDTQSGTTVETEFSHVNSDLILLPVYLLTYRYRDTIYRFLVNGQTGKTCGDKPFSGLRIGIAIGMAVLLILIIWLLFYLRGH
ncbi:MAG TPA: zinc ribbon domain-containing protein [Pirellulales bacterium]|jgi:DNA-directed RNA polymerase subunit RPC12/RpoP|nr:zinc ribbon domain-containing protein [Pirellulales bacterium]